MAFVLGPWMSNTPAEPSAHEGHLSCILLPNKQKAAY